MIQTPYFDLTGDGKVTAADFAAMAQDQAFAQLAGELIGAGVLASGNQTDNDVLDTTVAVLVVANDFVKAGAPLTPRAFAQKGIDLLQRINELAGGETTGGKLAAASLAGLEAFVNAYDWEDGTQPGEIPAAVTLFIQPILTAALSGLFTTNG